MAPAERFKVVKELSETSLMFVVHPTLDEEQVHHMARVVQETVANATLQYIDK